MKRLVDLYPYQKKQSDVLFLVLKRAPEVQYAGQWRMVGGKVLENESCHQGALRELEQETGLYPGLFWTLPSLNQFYDYQNDRILHIPAFGAEVNNDAQITLNHEHTSWKWISKHEIDSYILWPEQRRLMQLLSDIIMNNQILDEWIIDF